MRPSAFSGYLKLLTLGFNINRPYALHSAPKAGCEQCPLTHAPSCMSRAVPGLDDPSLQAHLLHARTLKATAAIHRLIPSQPLSELLPKCDTSDCCRAVAVRPQQIYGVRPLLLFLSWFSSFYMHAQSCVEIHTVSIFCSIICLDPIHGSLSYQTVLPVFSYLPNLNILKYITES